MARIRTIKPEFFTSETLSALSISARLTFIGLWTYVDDYGVGLFNERLILAALYPLDEDPSGALQRVSRDLRELSSVHVLSLYVVGNRRYLRVVNWEEHQTISHRSKPKFPWWNHPGATPLAWDDASQVYVNVANTPEDSGALRRAPGGLPEGSPLNREQGTGNREQGNTYVANELATAVAGTGCAPTSALGKIAATKPATRTRTEGTPEFDEFWNVYPRPIAKAAAWKKWQEIVKSGAEPSQIIAAAKKHREYHLGRGTEIEKIPHPTTWLNQKRYKDQSEQQALELWEAARVPRPSRAQQRSANATALVEKFARDEYGDAAVEGWGRPALPGEIVRRTP